MPAPPPRRRPARPPAARPAPGPLPGVPARAWRFAGLLLAVALGHQQLLGGLAHGLARLRASEPPAPLRPAPVTLRLLAAPAAAKAAPLATAPAPSPAAVPARPALRLPQRRPGTAPSAGPAPALAPDSAATAGPVAPTAEAAGAAPVALADDGASAAPPVYPTRPPPSATLHFSLERGDSHGQGLWHWEHDGTRFSTRLQAELGGRPWLDQHSQGGFDVAGLAPERLVEQQRGRAARAVNFQRDKGLVSFSGSARSWALWPGTQDRVSWLPQLMAIVTARPGGWQAGDRLRLAAASPRGELDLWHWQLADLAGPPEHPAPALHWVRTPQRPYDQRVDLWLSPQPPHWPLGWQWQVLPGGEPVRWWRQAAAPDP